MQNGDGKNTSGNADPSLRTDQSVASGALLLHHFAEIACNEVKKASDEVKEIVRCKDTSILRTTKPGKPPNVVSRNNLDLSPKPQDFYAKISKESSPKPAVCFAGTLKAAPLPPPLTLPSLNNIPHQKPHQLKGMSHHHSRLTRGRTPLQHKNHALKARSFDESIESKKVKYVGTSTPHKVRAVLKHKFSWKNYPEVCTMLIKVKFCKYSVTHAYLSYFVKLEQFLIEKREEYLRYSSTLNYTSSQKDFNNNLTTSVLKLAASHGYVFERFSFAQVRDRIRCYYKSYLQSIKNRPDAKSA